MASPDTPITTLLQSEAALVELYAGRLDQLHTELAAHPELQAEAAHLRALLDQGYSDLVVDQIEVLVARADRAVRQADALNLDYLLDTDTGAALQAQALRRVETSEQTVRALSARMEAAEDDDARVALAGAVRNAIETHRNVWVGALQTAGPEAERQSGSGALLLETVGRNLRRDLERADARAAAAERAAQAEQGEADQAPQTGLKSLDLGLLFGRQQAPREGYADFVQAQVELSRDAQPRPAQPAAEDPALLELMRARVRGSNPPAPQRTQLAELDRALADAARGYGAAYAVESALGQVQPSGADQAGRVQLGARIQTLVQGRLAASQRRLSALSAMPQAIQDAIARQHDAAVAQAEALQAQLQSGGVGDIDALQQVVQGLQDDLRAVRSVAPDALGDAERGSLAADVQALLSDAQSAAPVVAPAGVGEAEALRDAQASVAGQTEARIGDVDRATAALSEALRNDPDRGASAAQTDLSREANRGAEGEGQTSLRRITDRILSRTQEPLSYSAALPAAAITRIFAQDASPIEPMPRDGDEQRAFAADAGLASTSRAVQGAQALTGSGAPLATQIQQRAAMRSLASSSDMEAVRRQLGQFGSQVSRSLNALSGVFEAGLRSPRPAMTPGAMPRGGAQPPAIAPRMSASMPNNIFADTSSQAMQQSYMPALARVANLPGAQQAAPRASMDADAAPIGQRFASPDALFQALLGDLGERLRDEQPQLAAQLRGRLEHVAELSAGGQGADEVLERYTRTMRRTVRSWLGENANDDASDDAAIRQAMTTRTAAPRTDGPMGEIAREVFGGEPSAIEARLRSERKGIDQGIIERLERLFGRTLAGVEAYSGPTAGTIAREMGAEAFTVGRKMFFPDGALDTQDTVKGGLFAHEALHASYGRTTPDTSVIAQEEREAYALQGAIQGSGASSLSHALEQAAPALEIARDQPHFGMPAQQLQGPVGVRASTAANVSSDAPIQAKAGGEEDMSAVDFIPTKGGNKIPKDKLIERVIEMFEGKIRSQMERYGQDGT